MILIKMMITAKVMFIKYNYGKLLMADTCIVVQQETVVGQWQLNGTTLVKAPPDGQGVLGF